MFSKHSPYLALIAFGYSLGIGLAFYEKLAIDFSGFSFIILIALLLSLLYFTIKEPMAFWVFCFLMATVLGAQRMSSDSSKQAPLLVASSEKQLFLLKLSSVLKSSKKQNRYQAIAFSSNFSKDSASLIIKPYKKNKILVIQSKDSLAAPFKIGNIIWAEGYLSMPNQAAIPGEFNYKNYLKTQGIHFQLYLTKAYLKEGKTAVSFLERMARYKEKLLNKISESGLSATSFQLYSALIFGDKNELDPTVLNAFQNAGAVHILAISGLHIGILAGLLYSLFLPLHYFKIGRPLSGLLLIICLWGYAAFTGFSPSVLRAVSMWSFLGASLVLNRPQYGVHLLLVAYLANLIWDPLALFSLGFGMSYLAVFFILLGMPVFKEIWEPKNEIIKKLWQLLAVSICAQIGVLGLSLYAFNQFPLLFLVSNLLVIPFLGVVLSAGVFLALWFVIDKPSNIFIEGFDFMLQQLNMVISWVGSQEGFVLKELYFPKLYLLGFMAFTLGLLAWCYPYYKNARSWKYFIIGLLLLQISFGVQKQLNSTKKEHFIIKQKGQITLMGLGEQNLYYWSLDSLSKISFSKIKRYFPYEHIIKNNLAEVYKFKEEILVVSPKGPNKTKKIKWLIIDPKTTAYPNHFKAPQLSGTQFIFSGYAQTKQMHIWERWVKKNERPTWWLDAQGYYTFK